MARASGIVHWVLRMVAIVATLAPALGAAQSIGPGPIGAREASWIAREQRGAGAEYALASRRWTKNLAQSIAVSVDDAGARVRAPEGDVALRLAWIGRARGGPQRFARSAPRLDRNLATYTRSSTVAEWFVHGPLGLEHGFDLSHRPPGVGALELVVETSGTLLPVVQAGEIALLRGARTALLYGAAFAHDATGREVPIAVSVRGRAIVITVDDAHATYPVRVDPLVWREQSVLHDAAPEDYQGFGLPGIDLDGDRLAIGASPSDAVSIYRRTGTTWGLEQRLVGAGAERFGDQLSLDGDALAVVAPDALDGAGAVDVFRRGAGGWALEERVSPTDAPMTSGGTAVLQGDRLVVASCRHPEPGIVVFFERGSGGWSEVQRLVPSGASERACYGLSLSLDGERLAVGAPDQRDLGGVNRGAVFVVERGASGWTEVARIDGVDSFTGFGGSIALEGDTLVIGAPRPPLALGNAYVFHFDGAWTEEAALRPSDVTQPGAYFGISVALRGDSVAVGTLEDDAPLRFVGRVHLFGRTSGVWTRTEVIRPPRPGAELFFGHGVELGDRTLVVRTNGELPGYTLEGGVSVFALRLTDGEPCTLDDACHSGFCRDGVCCDSGCGDGLASDCMACSVTSGGAVDGVCGTVVSGELPVCRPEASVCDVPERCDGVSPACPADAFEDAGLTCRGSLGPCDPEEQCTGAAGTCPDDVRHGAETVCRASVAACDAEEVCDGASAECGADGLAGPETICRTAAAPCDAEERCSGTSLACPVDVLAADGASCDDGLACNGGAVCVAGLCEPGLAPDCDDDDPCTTDRCDEPLGCRHDRLPECCTSDADCDDGRACTLDSCAREALLCAHDTAACGARDASYEDAEIDLDGGLGEGDAGTTHVSWGCRCRASPRPTRDADAALAIGAMAGLAGAARGSRRRARR